MLFASLPLDANATDFAAYVEANAPGLGAAVARQYPVSAYKKTTYASAAWWAATHFLGDSQMSCPARRTARWISRAHASGGAAREEPVWRCQARMDQRNLGFDTAYDLCGGL